MIKVLFHIFLRLLLATFHITYQIYFIFSEVATRDVL